MFELKCSRRNYYYILTLTKKCLKIKFWEEKSKPAKYRIYIVCMG